MLPFMDYIVREFGTATDWNFDNSYSFLTATSDALLSFDTPQTATVHVSSLSTANFATSYTLSALGQLDGSLSYLYSNIQLDHVRSSSTSIPLRKIVEGYRDVPLPVKLEEIADALHTLKDGRKPILMHATLILPPPTTLTALYARRVRPDTLFSLFVDSRTVTNPSTSGSPPATILAHVQHDTGRYSIEGLGSSDTGLLGIRGLWNFGLGRPDAEVDSPLALSDLGGSPSVPLLPDLLQQLSPRFHHLSSKPSLLSAGAEFYYSPFSHVIGLSTGLRFTTLSSHTFTPATTSDTIRSTSKPLAGTSSALSSAILSPANIPTSSPFPYTMTLTANPIIGSLSTTYSVKPTSNLALSSQFDFNVYSWESQYVVGAEIWRRPAKSVGKAVNPNAIIAEQKQTEIPELNKQAEDWLVNAERDLTEASLSTEGENVVKLRIDDGWNIKALWTGKLKSLLVSAGVSVSPVQQLTEMVDEGGRKKRFTAKVGVSIAYST